MYRYVVEGVVVALISFEWDYTLNSSLQSAKIKPQARFKKR